MELPINLCFCVHCFFFLFCHPPKVTIRELSGDVNLTKAQIDETQIIVTTPEKRLVLASTSSWAAGWVVLIVGCTIGCTVVVARLYQLPITFDTFLLHLDSSPHVPCSDILFVNSRTCRFLWGGISLHGRPATNAPGLKTKRLVNRSEQPTTGEKGCFGCFLRCIHPAGALGDHWWAGNSSADLVGQVVRPVDSTVWTGLVLIVDPWSLWGSICCTTAVALSSSPSWPEPSAKLRPPRSLLSVFF